VLLVCSEPGTGRDTNSLKESIDFSKNIKKSDPLKIGDKGRVLVLGLRIVTSTRRYLKII
jgi:hypothetical protein